MTDSAGGGSSAVRQLSRHRRPIATVAIAAVAIVLASVVNRSDAVVFAVVDPAESITLYERAMEPGQHLTIEHVHSVTNRLVRERLVVLDDHRLGMVSLWFDQHGPNLPTGPEEIEGITTTYRELADGAVEVLHHERPVALVPMIVGSETVDHTIVFDDGHRLRLLDFADRWTGIELMVRASR